MSSCQLCDHFNSLCEIISSILQLIHLRIVLHITLFDFPSRRAHPFRQISQAEDCETLISEGKSAGEFADDDRTVRFHVCDFSTGLLNLGHY
jgi:hypothetical protein